MTRRITRTAWLRNLGSTPVSADLFLTPDGKDGISDPAVLRATLELPAGTTRRLTDVIATVFGAQGSGQLEIRSPIISALSLRTTTDALTGGDPTLKFGSEMPVASSGSGGAPGRSGAVRPGGLGELEEPDEPDLHRDDGQERGRRRHHLRRQGPDRGDGLRVGAGLRQGPEGGAGHPRGCVRDGGLRIDLGFVGGGPCRHGRDDPRQPVQQLQRRARADSARLGGSGSRAKGEPRRASWGASPSSSRRR